MIISSTEIEALEKSYRTNFVNSLSGFKGVFVIGTANSENNTNLAIFNSIMHIGANPGLMGFIQRPASVERHTYENIKNSGQFTINAVHQTWIEKAHQTAARFPRETSEFDAVGLTAQFSENFKAPFVQESHLKIGLSFAEEVEIKINNTLLIIGKIETIEIETSAIAEDGFIDHSKLQTAASVGLDAYYKTESLFRLSYAKPNTNPSKF